MRKEIVYFNAIFRKVHFTHTHIHQWEKPLDLLCEMEEPVIRQTQESTAGQNDFQQMVQFSESDHLLLQINLCVQVITL